MPSIDDNLRAWDRDDPWATGGEQWSGAWGSSEGLWFGTLLPRLAAFLPAGHLLEIACGHGRVTRFLLGHCERYTGVDLAPSCVDACARRFATVGKASFHRTDGSSLAMVAPASIDFAVSWDSLVHVDLGVLRGYLDELARVLRPGGAAFLHHSNLGALDGAAKADNPHWRDASASAAAVREHAATVGLHCPVQELVQWERPRYTDCFTVVCRPHGRDTVAPKTVVSEHPDMSAEMAHFARIGALYRR